MRIRPVTIATIAVMACLSTVKAADITLAYTGMGGQLGMVIPDDTPGDIDVGFAFGAHGDVAFRMGQAGHLHYYPSLTGWFGGEDVGGIDYTGGEVLMNFFDVKYSFPIPAPIHPFVGLGGPVIDIQLLDTDPDFNDSYPEVDMGFNLFAGVDFLLSSSTILFVEMRGKYADWDLFRMVAGMTVQITGRMPTR